MEKERRIKTLSVVALIIAIAGLTVAFAALSTTLTINGNAGVDSAKWDIHFVNYSDYMEELEMTMDECVLQYGDACKGIIKVGNGKLNGEPVISGTEISNLNFSISKPEDSVTYSALFQNSGTIDAKVSDILVNGKMVNSGENIVQVICGDANAPVESCDWDNDGVVSENDAENTITNISLTYDFEDLYDDKLSVGNVATFDINLAYKGRVCITVGNRKNCSDNEATKLPKRNLEFNNLTFDVITLQK